MPLTRVPWPRVTLVAVCVATLALAAVLTVRRVAPREVRRFEHVLPEAQAFRNNGRPVMAVSPDGRAFVFATPEGLYVRSMDALDARLLADTETALGNPFFSPDSRSIAYFDGRLIRVPAAGGSPVVICTTPGPVFGASWGVDDQILFGQPGGVMRVSADGGTPTLVIPTAEGEQAYGPRQLPGGDRVLFTVTRVSGSSRWDQAEIVVQSVSSDERTVLVRGGSDARYVSTGHLVYAQGDTLFAIGFDAGRRRVIGERVPIVRGLARAGDPAVNTGAANYDVSDDGTLVYVRADSPGDFPSPRLETSIPPGTLVWVDRRGREEALGTPPRAYVYPRLSPDGARVAVDSRDDALDVWIWDVARRTLTPLTFHPALDASPVWAPDGRRVVFSSARAGGSLNLYWQPSNGTGTLDRLTDSTHVQRALGFTPDGRRLLLADSASSREPPDLALLSLDGERPVTWVTRTPFSEFGAEISPDGRWLAYESDPSGQREIHVRAFADADGDGWLVSAGGGSQPLWSHDGRELFYLAPDGTLMSAAVDAIRDGAPFRTGPPSPVIAPGPYRARSGTQAGRTYDVSPDGGRFLRIKVEGGAVARGPRSLVVVQNWAEELKRLVPRD
ncbi:MAG TPA: hypothetical protein VD833_21935 [Vicinamibacterales bacterium]|nr:hypothetical protein [Vicinamibacterales bacterium]